MNQFTLDMVGEGRDFHHCNRCGLCLPACPTYRETRLETQSPRGRLALIRAVARGDLEPGPGFVAHLYHCLYCRACETACPAGIPVGQWVAAARTQVEMGRAQPILKRLILRHILPHQQRLEASFWVIKLYQKLGLDKALGGLLPATSLLPPLSRRPLSGELPEVTPAHGEVRFRVGFFLGCAMNLFFPQASAASVRVLAHNGCEVVTPQGLACCGAPHLSLGDTQTAITLARRNIDLFEAAGVDFIVSDCAACSTTLKEYGRLLAHDSHYSQRAQAVSRKARDITEFLADIPFRREMAPIEQRVTYHEPCHLAHAQGIRQQPRALLRAIPGLELVEMSEADSCCGSAGSYVLTHYQRSMAILGRKMDNIAATRAQVVATGNPGCLLQLNRGAKHLKSNIKVLHPMELLDQAYRARAQETP